MSVHWRQPLRLAPDGSIATVEQGSFAEVGQAARLVLTTRIGERLDLPDFGTDPEHPGEGLDIATLAAVVGQWEPRARLTALDDGQAGPVVTIRMAVDIDDDSEGTPGV